MNETGRDTSVVLEQSAVWDSADGLRRAGGNAKLFLKIVGQFLDGQIDAAQRIRACLNEGEAEVAQRVAHSVKGVAGNIGATRTRIAAANIEEAIKTGASEKRIELLVFDLATELSALSSELVAFLESQPPDNEAADAQPPDAASVKAIVEKLTALLEGFDPGAADVVESEKPALRILFAPEELASFEQLVNGYSFDEALELLRGAARRQGHIE